MTAVADLPDDGLTLPELADLIPQLRRRTVQPLPINPPDYGPVHVTSLTATVHLSDGRRLEVEIPDGVMPSRFDVRQDLISRGGFTVAVERTLAVALGNVQDWRVRVYEPEACRPDAGSVTRG